jgi:hypothetical protein
MSDHAAARETEEKPVARGDGKANGNGSVEDLKLLLEVARTFEPALRHVVEKFQALKEKGSSATQGERLAAYRVAGDAGIIDQDTVFMLTANLVARIWEERCEGRSYRDLLGPIMEKMKAIEEEHGTAESRDWPTKEIAEAYEALEKEWERTTDRLMADILREYGEDDMARLLVSDPSEFRRRVENGRRLLMKG